MNKVLYSILAVIFVSTLNASSINLEIKYQEAKSGEKVRLSNSVDFTRDVAVSNPGMYKTLFVIELSNLIKSSLTEYHAALKRHYEIMPANELMIYPPPVPRDWERLRREQSQKLAHNLEKLECPDASCQEAVAFAKKLSDNMLRGEFGPVFENHAPSMAGFRAKPQAMTLNVTAGGVKDYSHFKKQVEDGYVPLPDAFIEEGFLSSFDLSLESGRCDQLLCLNPAYAYDSVKKRLYVQVGMDSNVTPDTFTRRPQNLAFVIDISGSMAACDNTERTRLEWVKDAVSLALSHLDADDIVSIVLFDTVSEVLLEPTTAANRAAILDQLKPIQPKNSTNLYAGLLDGYRLVSQGFRDGYENRVILLSDAGLNTGNTAHDSIVRLVGDYASENIGLTAIGVGENFHHAFIHKISQSRGGNAHFVHSGSDMLRFFDNFAYLVTPVAYNLKVSAELVDLPAKLVKAYGVPMGKNEPVQELINVRTLFFSQEGGAIVLEYAL